MSARILTVLFVAWVVIAVGCEDLDYSNAGLGSADGGAPAAEDRDSTVADADTGVDRAQTVGLWHMDEVGTGVATLADSSGMGNDLVRVATSQRVTGHAGRFGLAIGEWEHTTNAGSLEDYFASTSLSGTATLTQLTFEFWLFVRASGVVNDPNPFGLGAVATDHFRIDDSNRLEFHSGRIPRGHLSTDVLPLGTWNHIALTWDTTFVRIWLNGALAAEEVALSPPAIDFLRVGAQNTGNANLSSGLVDEVRLSDGVRYSAPFSPPGGPFCIANSDCDSGYCNAGGVCVQDP